MQNFAQVPSAASSSISKSDGHSLTSHVVANSAEDQNKPRLQEPSIPQNPQNHVVGELFQNEPMVEVPPMSQNRIAKSPIVQTSVSFSRLNSLSNPGKQRAQIAANHDYQVSAPESSPAKRSLQTDEESTDGRHSPKRKRTKPSFFDTNSFSRRGKLPVTLALDISAIPDDLPDPAISARQHRQDWLAARRGSESSAARESPISTPKHAMSMSSLADKDSRGNSGLATPIFVDEVKTAGTLSPTNGTWTRTMAGKVSESVVAKTPQGTPQVRELQIEMDVDSPLALKGAQLPSVSRMNPKSSTAQAQGLTKKSSDSEDLDATRNVSPELDMPPRPRASLSAADERPKNRSSGLDPVKSAEGESIGGASSSEVPRNPIRHLDASAKVSSAPSSQPGKIQVAQAPGPSKTSLDRSTARASVQTTSAQPAPAIQIVFDAFKAAYSDYTGDARHFLTLCKKIEKLWKLDRMVNKSMWDDYVIRNKVEYAQYLKGCSEAGDDPMPYEKFYNDEIEGPKYCKKIITPQSLESIVHGDGPKPMLSDTSVASTPVRTSFSSTTPASVNRPGFGLESARKPAVTIDLTDDDPIDTIRSSKGAFALPTVSSKSTPRRRVPWLEKKEPQPYLHTPEGKPKATEGPHQPFPPGSQMFSQSAARKETFASAPMPPGAPSASRGNTAYATSNSETISNTTNPARMPPPVASTANMSRATERVQMPRKQGQHAAKGKGKEATSMPTTDPLDGPNANVGDKTQKQDKEHWWQDEDAPFKIFFKSYVAIRPGHGNSFAKPEDIAHGQKEHKSKVRELRHLDVLGWQL